MSLKDDDVSTLINLRNNKDVPEEEFCTNPKFSCEVPQDSSSCEAKITFLTNSLLS